MIMGGDYTEYRYVNCALEALASFNLLAGFEARFASRKPTPSSADLRRAWARLAVHSVGAMDAYGRWDDWRAQLEAERLAGMSREVATMTRLPGLSPDAPALVYLITHEGLGAAKIGIGDVSGMRLAQHRRKGLARSACRRT